MMSHSDTEQRIPAGQRECPVCKGDGGDADHVGDSWDDSGRYKGVFKWTTCWACEGEGHVEEGWSHPDWEEDDE